MKRLITWTALLMMLFVFPAAAQAAAAEYPVTGSFLDYLDENGIGYSYMGVGESGLETVLVSFGTSDQDLFDTEWHFDGEYERVAVRIYDVISYDPEAYFFVLNALNKINSKYRYIRFFADESDNTVTAAYDMPVKAGTAGKQCGDILNRILGIVDYAREVLGEYDTSAASGSEKEPDENTGTAGNTAADAGVSTLYPDAEGVELSPSSYNESAPDWTTYEELIRKIRTDQDLEERTALMHQAEDILMSTAAVVPLFYYNDRYLQKSDISGIYVTESSHHIYKFARSPRDVLKISTSSEPSTLDPGLNSVVEMGSMDLNLFEGLYTYNEEGALVPALCDPEDPYELSEDGTVYTFHLREGLKWSDGSPLTAEDFVYSWKRAGSEETGGDYRYLFDCFARKEDGSLDVAAMDDVTLAATLAAPCAYFLDLCAFPTYLPVPRAEVEAAGGEGSWCLEAGFVTNGAYTVTSWSHGESLVFAKNDNYYRADEVTIPLLQFIVSRDPLGDYRAGNLDFLISTTIPVEEIPALVNDLEFCVKDTLGIQYAMFNVNAPLFEGKTLRQAVAMRKAMSLLIDRDMMVDTLGKTGQRIATSFVPAGMADGNGGIFKENTEAYTFPVAEEEGYYPSHLSDANVEEAIALLKYAGYEFTGEGMLSEETPLSLTYLSNNLDAALCIKESLSRIGIEVVIDERDDWNDFFSNMRNGNFDISFSGWVADFNDPINMLEMWTAGSGNNNCRLGRGQTDEKAAAREEGRLPRRKKTILTRS